MYESKMLELNDNKSVVFSVPSKPKYEPVVKNTGHGSFAVNTGERSFTSNTGDWAVSANTGNASTALSNGYWSGTMTTGLGSFALNTGDCSTALTIGSWSASAVSKRQSVAVATGNDSKAMAGAGGAIVLVYRNEQNVIVHIRASKVGENGILPDTWYKLNKTGEFEIVEEIIE